MSKKNRMLFVTVTLLILVWTIAVAANDVQSELAEVRAATARFHRPEVAQAEGYELGPDLAWCMEQPGVGGMGYHYINRAKVDTTVDMLQPEVMVYVPGPNGKLQLGAVEYLVPAEAWHAEGHTDLPAVLGQEFHYASLTGNYILHAWIWKHNPAGVFEDWKPNVSCP